MGKMARQQKYKSAVAKSVQDTHDKIFSGAETPVGKESEYFPKVYKGGGFEQPAGKDVEKDFPNVKIKGNHLDIKPTAETLKTVSSPSTRSKNWLPGE
jgi:hypothetical protein